MSSFEPTMPLTARICVSDNGIGFDPKYTEQIFEPFQRLHGPDDYEGSGIGLAICRKIVQRHGGQVGVETHPGSGSVFWFTLPVATGHDDPVSEQDPAMTNQRETAARRRQWPGPAG